VIDIIIVTEAGNKLQNKHFKQLNSKATAQVESKGSYSL
jgi:hypothetical protein